MLNDALTNRFSMFSAAMQMAGDQSRHDHAVPPCNGCHVQGKCLQRSLGSEFTVSLFKAHPAEIVFYKQRECLFQRGVIDFR